MYQEIEDTHFPFLPEHRRMGSKRNGSLPTPDKLGNVSYSTIWSTLPVRKSSERFTEAVCWMNHFSPLYYYYYYCGENTMT